MHYGRTTARPETGEVSRPLLTVTVLYTDVRHTIAALRQAAGLGRGLHASLRILMPVVVPYPLQLSEPPVDCRIVHRRLATVAEGVDMPTRIDTVYCRDLGVAVEKSLPPQSIVVVCWRRRRLFDKTRRLTQWLTALGHNVIAPPFAKGD